MPDLAFPDARIIEGPQGVDSTQTIGGAEKMHDLKSHHQIGHNKAISCPFSQDRFFQFGEKVMWRVADTSKARQERVAVVPRHLCWRPGGVEDERRAYP